MLSLRLITSSHQWDQITPINIIMEKNILRIKINQIFDDYREAIHVYYTKNLPHEFDETNIDSYVDHLNKEIQELLEEQ